MTTKKLSAKDEIFQETGLERNPRGGYCPDKEMAEVKLTCLFHPDWKTGTFNALGYLRYTDYYNTLDKAWQSGIRVTVKNYIPTEWIVLPAYHETGIIHYSHNSIKKFQTLKEALSFLNSVKG